MLPMLLIASIIICSTKGGKEKVNKQQELKVIYELGFVYLFDLRQPET